MPEKDEPEVIGQEFDCLDELLEASEGRESPVKENESFAGAAILVQRRIFGFGCSPGLLQTWAI
jgi:hypothetical protein